MTLSPSGIQHYRFENKCTDNIFADVYYNKFNDTLHQLLSNCPVRVNMEGECFKKFVINTLLLPNLATSTTWLSVVTVCWQVVRLDNVTAACCRQVWSYVGSSRTIFGSRISLERTHRMFFSIPWSSSTPSSTSSTLPSLIELCPFPASSNSGARVPHQMARRSAASTCAAMLPPVCCLVFNFSHGSLICTTWL